MYVPERSRVQQIVIDGRVNNQQIVNIFYLRNSTPAAGGDGSSVTLLSAFRTAFRATIRQQMHDSWTVASYVMTEISDVIQVGATPLRLKTVFDPEKKEWFPGTAADTGVIALGVMLPAHEALRAKATPMTTRRGFFRGNGNRFAPFSEAAHDDTDPEKWTAAVVTAWNTELFNFISSSFSDGGAGGANWAPAIWSAPYFFKVVKPAGGSLYKGAELIGTFTASAYVGTQVTRRYNASGQFRGR